MRELNDAAQHNGPIAPAVPVTSEGIVLAEMGTWQKARDNGQAVIECSECSLSADEALQFILARYRPSRGWNAFIRVYAALTLEPGFEERALANQRSGGKQKGSLNLSKAERIETKREIARAAGVGPASVSKVKFILDRAHPEIIEALKNGVIRIHRAWCWCKLPESEQIEKLAGYEEVRATAKIIRNAILEPGQDLPGPAEAINDVQRQSARAPGLIKVCTSRYPQTFIVLGQELLSNRHPQLEMKLT